MSRVSLHPELRSARDAREFVQQQLGATKAPADVVDTALLLTTEVATNAIVHARTPFSIEVSFGPERVRILVCDEDPQLPVRHPPEPGRVGGWGMHLVDTLSAGWGAMQIPRDGKCVWFDVAT